nr:hypothetical protein [Nannocystis sp.]
MKPSPSRSRSGHPSGAMPGSTGHESALSRKPSPSLSFSAFGSGRLAVQRQREAEQDLGIVGRAGVDAQAGRDHVAHVEAHHEAVGDVELHTAAEVRRRVDVAAQRAAGAQQAAADEDERSDPPERQLADHVTAEVEQRRATAGRAVGRHGHRRHDAAFDFTAEEGERVPGEAQADLRRDLLVRLVELLRARLPGVDGPDRVPLLLRVEQLVRARGAVVDAALVEHQARGREHDAAKDAELEHVALGSAAADPLLVGSVLALIGARADRAAHADAAALVGLRVGPVGADLHSGACRRTLWGGRWRRSAGIGARCGCRCACWCACWFGRRRRSRTRIAGRLRRRCRQGHQPCDQ